MKRSIGTRVMWTNTTSNKNTKQSSNAKAVRDKVFDFKNYEMHNQLGHTQYRDNLLNVIIRSKLET